MRLELASFQVEDVEFSSETRLSAKTLYVNENELKEHLLPDPYIEDIRMEVARPGESTRIVHAVDVVEPRDKASGPGGVFPGRLGSPTQVGSGTTNRLAGMTVIGTAEPFVGEEYWYAREAIIDMSGPGAEFSPFSQTVNLVLHFIPKAGGEELDPARRKQFIVDTRTRDAEFRMKATRQLCLKAAKFLAGKVKGMTPDHTQAYELGPVDPGLPGVVYLCKSLSASFYGSFSTTRNWVVPMHPNEMMDGAVLNFGFLIAANFRDSTYSYQLNDIVEELYSRHGVDLNFLGVLFYSAFPYTLENKELEAGSVVRTAKMLGADAAIIAPLSDGHPSVETMMICRMCEEAGISTAIGAGEMTARGGRPRIYALGTRGRRPCDCWGQPPQGETSCHGQGHRREPGAARGPGGLGGDRGRGPADVRGQQPGWCDQAYGSAVLAVLPPGEGKVVKRPHSSIRPACPGPIQQSAGGVLRPIPLCIWGRRDSHGDARYRQYP